MYLAYWLIGGLAALSILLLALLFLLLRAPKPLAPPEGRPVDETASDDD